MYQKFKDDRKLRHAMCSKKKRIERQKEARCIRNGGYR